MTAVRAVCLIGFGEVGQRLARDLHAAGVSRLAAWDLKFDDPHSAPSAALVGSPARAARSALDAASGADLIISAVTAADCLADARTTAELATGPAFYLDMNSVAPETKLDAQRALRDSQLRYVEAAVMSPIAPKGVASPVLLGGPHAEEFLLISRSIGFTGAEFYSPVTGRASAAKMCRSVVIKGIEALLAESLVTARRYGVEQTVLTSLHGLLPAADWKALAYYMISRALEHGVRRADEMREAALTVAGAGLDPWMARACVSRQDWCASLGQARRESTLEAMLDALLAHIPDPRGEG